MQITYAVEEAVTTQHPPRRCVRPPGLLLFLSAGRYYGAACRGSQYAGRRSARTAAVNQHPEVAGTDRSEPSSAGTRPLPQPPPTPAASPTATLHRLPRLPPPEERGSLVPQSGSQSRKPPHKATGGVRLRSTGSGLSAPASTRLFFSAQVAEGRVQQTPTKV